MTPKLLDFSLIFAADILGVISFSWRNGVTSRRYARKFRISEIFFKHLSVMYRWKACYKLSI